jgi:hypothetical protein
VETLTAKTDYFYITRSLTKNYKTLIHGDIYYFDISSDGRIAYTIHNTKESNDYNLHVAYFYNNGIETDELVYSDKRYLSSLKWCENGKILFCVYTNGKDSIFRFTFQTG